MKTDESWIIYPGGVYPRMMEGVTPLGLIEEVME
jgi:hypothetical protein